MTDTTLDQRFSAPDAKAASWERTSRVLARVRGPPGQGPRVRQGTVRSDPAPPGLVPWPAGGLMDTLLPGISAERVPTSRLTVNTLAVAGRQDGDGPAVLFVHGNVSS